MIYDLLSILVRELWEIPWCRGTAIGVELFITSHSSVVETVGIFSPLYWVFHFGIPFWLASLFTSFSFTLDILVECSVYLISISLGYLSHKVGIQDQS